MYTFMTSEDEQSPPNLIEDAAVSVLKLVTEEKSKKYSVKFGEKLKNLTGNPGISSKAAENVWNHGKIFP